MNLKELELKIKSLTNEWTEISTEATIKVDGLKKQIEEAKVSRQQLLDDLNTDTIELAKTVISIRGSYAPEGNKWHPKRGDDGNAVDKAIADLANGCHELRKEYFGVKVYSGFGRQGSSHPYGYGPSHGSIVFAIELKSELRGFDLTDDQINAALYYLHNIEKIQNAAKKAAA